MTILLGRRVVGPPAPPAWFSDTCELWARSHGRHAKTTWDPPVGCFVTRLSRMSHDPVLALVQSGKAEDVGAPIYWHEWKEGVRKHPMTGQMVGGWVPMDIEQLGESGVRTHLDRIATWTGRAEFKSVDHAADSTVAANERKMQDQKAKLRDGLKEPFRAAWKKGHGEATVNVPDQITSD